MRPPPSPTTRDAWSAPHRMIDQASSSARSVSGNSAAEELEVSGRTRQRQQVLAAPRPSRRPPDRTRPHSCRSRAPPRRPRAPRGNRRRAFGWPATTAPGASGPGPLPRRRGRGRRTRTRRRRREARAASGPLRGWHRHAPPLVLGQLHSREVTLGQRDHHDVADPRGRRPGQDRTDREPPPRRPAPGGNRHRVDAVARQHHRPREDGEADGLLAVIQLFGRPIASSRHTPRLPSATTTSSPSRMGAAVTATSPGQMRTSPSNRTPGAASNAVARASVGARNATGDVRGQGRSFCTDARSEPST